MAGGVLLLSSQNASECALRMQCLTPLTLSCSLGPMSCFSSVSPFAMILRTRGINNIEADMQRKMRPFWLSACLCSGLSVSLHLSPLSSSLPLPLGSPFLFPSSPLHAPFSSLPDSFHRSHRATSEFSPRFRIVSLPASFQVSPSENSPEISKSVLKNSWRCPPISKYRLMMSEFENSRGSN